MLDITKPQHAAAIAAMRDELTEMVDKLRRAAKAKEAATNTNKSPELNLKAMAALPASPELQAIFATFEDTLADLMDEPDSWELKGQEHIYANLAQVCQTYADHFTNLAKLWAPSFKSHAQVVTFTDDDKLSDAEIQELTKNCDSNFRAIIGMVNQIKNRQNDKSAQSLIEEITGQSTVVRERQGNVEFLLEIPRFRKPRTPNTSNSSATHGDHKSGPVSSSRIVLWIDGDIAPGDTYGEQVRTAFGVSVEDFHAKLDKLNPDLLHSLDTRLIYLHDGNEHEVELEKRTDS